MRILAESQFALKHIVNAVTGKRGVWLAGARRVFPPEMRQVAS